MSSGVSAVDTATVSDLHKRDDARIVVDRVDYPIVALADAIVVMPRELFATWWTRVVGEAPQTFRDAAEIGVRESTQFPCSDFFTARLYESPPHPCASRSAPDEPLEVGFGLEAKAFGGFSAPPAESLPTARGEILPQRRLNELCWSRGLRSCYALGLTHKIVRQHNGHWLRHRHRPLFCLQVAIAQVGMRSASKELELA